MYNSFYSTRRNNQTRHSFDKESQFQRLLSRLGFSDQSQPQTADNIDRNDPCKKYLESSVLIKKDGYGLQKKLKKLKRIILDKFKNCKYLMIYTSKVYPMIFFKYTENQQFGLPKYKHLRQIFKEIPNLREKRDMIDSIYERLFLKVNKGYFKICAFAIDRANEIRVKMQVSDILNLDEGREVMFYYLKDAENGTVKFTVFDKSMRTIEFDSEFIENHKGSHPKEYKIYQDFIKSIFLKEKQLQINDLFWNQEIEGEETELPPVKMSIGEMKKRLDEILKKEINQVQENGNESQEEPEESLGDDKEREKRMEERRLDELENRRNFEFTRLEVQRLLRGVSIYNQEKLYEKCIKKMIIAQKQLQSNLPIIAKKRKIFELLKSQNLLVIEGETGSGKSTQLPQILCEYYGLLDNPQALPVLVTQPRRLATRSIAERVALQMGETVGNFVDYVASANRTENKEAKIIFKLDRLVLDEITEDPLLSKYSCLVIDEAHERTISMDVILGLVKELLQKRKDFKVIVTSASMDIHLFQRYFNTRTFKVNGRIHPIKITYKDYQRFREGDKFQAVFKIRKVIDQEILHDKSSMKSEFKGHLLCFCSNLEEINELVRIYTEKLNKNMFVVYPLHGKISPADQQKVFSEEGRHKFIFASRIAETAITIDGVRVVIDPGQDVQLVYDQKYKVSSMKLQQISQSSAKQRAGRSGRTGPGHCFRLYSQANFKKRKINKVPQIENTSLDTAMLRLKTLKVKDVINFPYITRPDEDSMKTSLSLLHIIGALKGAEQNYQPTSIGNLLVKMPIQPFLGRAIIESMIFDKLITENKEKLELSSDESQLLKKGVKKTTIDILSLLLNFSGLFLINKQEKEQGQMAKYNEFSDEDGDFFFLMNIFNKYKALKSAQANMKGKQSNYTHNKSQLTKWVSESYLNPRALVEAEKLAKQLLFIADRFTIDEKIFQQDMKRVKAKLFSCHTFKQVILSSIITSFCSNLCKFSGNPLIGYTVVTQRRPIHIYGSSNLSLLGINADWIICFDLYTNDVGRLFCKVAHQVPYEFLKTHINQYVWNEFQIQKIQDQNPFYLELPLELPTKIINQIRSDYQNSQTKEHLAFLRNLFPIFIDEKNKISFFLMTDPKNPNNQTKQTQQKIDQYIQSILKSTQQHLFHNFISNINVEFDNGFVIKDIDLKYSAYCIEIISSCYVIEHFDNTCSQYGKITVSELTSMELRRFKNNGQQLQRMRFIPNNQADKKDFLEYVQLVSTQIPNITLEVRQALIDQMGKVAKSRAYIHFFAGASQQTNVIFLKYDNRTDKQIVFKTLDQLKYGIRKRQIGSIVDISDTLMTDKIKPAKKKNGINVFDHHLDQFQLSDVLRRMIKDKYLSSDFVFPRSITKFRDPIFPQACKTDNEWKEDIYRLLSQIKISRDSVLINISGFFKASKFKKYNNEVKIRVNMRAQIFSLDKTRLDDIRINFDGQRLLGCERMHIKIYHDQVIAFVNYKVFEGLEEEFQNLVAQYKIKYPDMHFITTYKNVRGILKAQIMARSQSREDFYIIQSQVTTLFTPKLLKLSDSQYRFISQLEDGESILDEIQHLYNYKIYFAFEKYSKSLKIYCKSHELRPIEAELKARIKIYKFSTDVISYQGMNLNIIRALLDRYTENKHKEVVMTYEIKFETREISITSSLDILDKIQAEVAKIALSIEGQCEICADAMINPYKFLNCSCSFCWQCITDHIKNFKGSTESILLCPRQECKAPINMHDIKTIISEDQFQDICEIKIKQFVEANRDKYYSCNICDHFFDRKEIESKGEINCEVCESSNCVRCGQSHSGYTCSDWRDRNSIMGKLLEFNIKVCKGCGQGIQKNGGCNHVTCFKCKAHICWKCGQVFQTSTSCCDHLVKFHNGIFDDGIRE